MSGTKPNVILFGVGHSGTSIATRMIHALGWNPADADKLYSESVSVRRMNEAALVGIFDLDQAKDILKSLGQPWAIKDPRFVRTIDDWMPAFADYQPFLVWLVRDHDAVRGSYRKRDEVDPYDLTIEKAFELAAKAFTSWPWCKTRLEYERIAAAIRLFKL